MGSRTGDKKQGSSSQGGQGARKAASSDAKGSMSGFSNDPKEQQCRHWQRSGWCSFGDRCKFKHSGESRQKSTKRRQSDEVRRFVQQLDRSCVDIDRSEKLWFQCWEEAEWLDFVDLKQLVTALAKLPFSLACRSPPILQCKSALLRYLAEEKSKGAADILQSVEIMLNVVRRLLKFEWEASIEDVREALFEVVGTARSSLLMQLKDHRETSRQVQELIEELEKPWIIKSKSSPPENVVEPCDIREGAQPHKKWRSATVEWLCQTELFCPTSLPKMSVPGSKSGGVYDSREQYLDTVERLMVAMTFSDASAAVTPRCSKCSNQLWPLPHSIGLSCRSRNCHGTVVVACANKNHNSGLCQKCNEAATKNLLGGPGQVASTHIYDGIVHSVDVDGKVCIRKFKSRCPPHLTIHWRSTKRLSCPNLVGVVITRTNGAPLGRGDRIWWGEIVLHGQPKEESQRRQEGCLAINMTTVANDFDLDGLAEGDSVAIIDCMTFVPEYVPVLRALEQQRLHSLPFDDGNLLNLSASSAVDLQNTVEEIQDLSNLERLVEEMVNASQLQPITEIRRDTELTSKLNHRLCDLLRQANLDKGQLASFVSALRHSVHLTQGPPGTGKSYLGVVVVRALMIIRDLWIQKNSSVGTPPILVLSYKNHAIDEFLCDLVQVERSTLNSMMIRIGTPGDGRLTQYSERTFKTQDPQIVRCQRDVKSLHQLGIKCKRILESHSVLAGCMMDLDCMDIADDAARKRRHAANKATKILLESIVRSKRLANVLANSEQDNLEDPDFLWRFDFLADEENPRGRWSIQGLDPEIPELYDGIKHYQRDYHEILLMFILGEKPLPRCLYVDADGIACEEPATSQVVSFCKKHQCHFTPDDGYQCQEPITKGKSYCALHACIEPHCQLARISLSQDYCNEHACIKCLKQGLRADKVISNDLCVEHSGFGRFAPTRSVHLSNDDDEVEETQDDETVVRSSISGCTTRRDVDLSDSSDTRPKKKRGREKRRKASKSNSIDQDSSPRAKKIYKKDDNILNRVEETKHKRKARKANKEHTTKKKKRRRRSRSNSQHADATRSSLRLTSRVDVDARRKKSKRKRKHERHNRKDYTKKEERRSTRYKSRGHKRKRSRSRRDVKSASLSPSHWRNDSDSTGQNDSSSCTRKQRKRKFSPSGSCSQCVSQDKNSRKRSSSILHNSQPGTRFTVSRKGADGSVDHLATVTMRNESGGLSATKDDALNNSAERAMGSVVTIDDPKGQGYDEADATSKSAEKVAKDVATIEDPKASDDIDAGQYDNPDEVEEADHLQHLREIFDVASGKDSEEGDADSLPNAEGEHDDAKEHAREVRSATVHIKLSAKQRCPTEWTWDMSPQERQNACQALMEKEREMISTVVTKTKSKLLLARKSLQQAKIKASAKVYENKSIIGGTIVGCISRLEAIRSTNPFAIVVEEASEVLEPLLLSCLCSSVKKIEQIGDHLQLQPSIMQKFNFERINRINVSMFERLIRAPDRHRVPSSVLSIQRRMRRNICDLTRDYYKDIVAIEDHETCSTKVLPGSLAEQSYGAGREIPGLQSHIFVWTHAGDQEKADVGLSKINRREADMAYHLAYFLVACGVQRSSIAILTPYKGQLMLIRTMLLKDRSPKRLLTWDRTEKDQIRLSTVDRFQGDEADIVIISLVVDGSSRTPFVKLVNRMIVLLSRARLGMFILGNTDYFDNSHSDAKHWTKTFELLQHAPLTSDNSNESVSTLFGMARVGEKLPLRCPQHPESGIDALRPEELEVGFCKACCEVELPCSHKCGLPCHWPSQKHNSKCTTMVASPCTRHVDDIACWSVFAHAKGVKSGEKVEVALANYRCPVSVSVKLPCGHEQRMSCAEETDISEGRTSWPRCGQQSPTPYVYPKCKHKLDVTCYQLEEYNRNPTAARVCTHEVDYVPSCGHTQRIACYLRQQYGEGIAQFVCPEKLDISLPRCGHPKKVSCSEEIALRSWAGKASDHGLVEECGNYGPKDSTCKHSVTYVRICGHESKLPCEDAFEMAKTNTLCREVVQCWNPKCGHPCDLPCFEARQVRSVQQVPPSPIAIVNEGDSLPSPPVSVNVSCAHTVTLRRKCGHTQKIACSTAYRRLPKCIEESAVRSPLCGHEISVPCHLRESLLAWRTWNQNSYNGLLENETLPCGADPEHARQPSDEMRKSMRACGKSVSIVQTCGHVASIGCAHLLKLVIDGSINVKCMEMVTKPLRCGHMESLPCHKYKDYMDGKVDIRCKQTTTRPCWNADICGCAALPIPCASDATLCCDTLNSWQCPTNPDHKFKLPLCKDGTPQQCPECSRDALLQAISSVNDQMDCSLPSCFQDLLGKVESLPPSERTVATFRRAKTQVLRRFKEHVDEFASRNSLFEAPLFAPHLVPCFYILDSWTAQTHGRGFFPLRKFVTRQTLNGIQVHRFSADNFLSLANRSRGGSVVLLCGYAYILNACLEQQWPNQGNIEEAMNVWNQKRYDCMEEKLLKFGLKRFILWEPCPIYATHLVTLSREDLTCVARKLQMPSYKIDPCYVCYDEPPGTKRQVITPDKADVVATAKHDNESLFVTVGDLQGSLAQTLDFPKDWNHSLAGSSGVFSESLEKELYDKLSFVNEDADPFAGKNLLEKIAKSEKSPLVDLLLSLELCSKDHDRALNDLKKYLGAMHNKVVHPLTLLALYRIEGLDKALHEFVKMYPAASHFLMPAENAKAVDQEKEFDNHSSAVSADAAELWKSMKAEHAVSSEAMDKLMALTGVRKVKLAAVHLFKTAQAFQRMAPEHRKANSLSLNYCFLGNPGTGKTTVARLFAEVLRDCNMRKTNSFEECTAQKLKDDGADEFRKKAQGAIDGVLFIDEAYDLDPVGDRFKGAPIANELVTLSENQRDNLTIILAGYEDDMNTKFFAYNDGLKSRFQEVVFEDFDEAELTSIWKQMREERGWEEATSKLASVVIRRMVRDAGKKGFGNAREVRKRLETATQRAMARPDFDGSLILQMTDVVGEDPRKNSKLDKVVEEIEGKIGWTSIKKAVANLIEVCGTNYRRELDGLQPLPITLNRMFLGNPGTGKTTCAKLYGQLLKHLGFLSNGDVMFKSAGDLGGSVVGEAQKKTLDILNGAVGKVLVIDEAYNLDDNLYGKQILDTIVEKVQGSENDDIAVLLLGYEAEMLSMLRNQNPGLQRRFPADQAFRFEDYTSQELLKIMLASCTAKNVRMSLEFQEKAIEKLDMCRRSEAHFGNAGAVNNLITAGLQKASSRGSAGSGEVRLEACDVDVGPEGGTSKDPFAPLDKLYRMEEVKHKLQRMSNAYKVAQQEGDNTPELQHFVFVGSPGTGKTTVARVMAQILYDLGLIHRNHVEETSGLSLTGQFVGQTKKVVEERLDAAKGGVLFIDEAYELGRGHYGTEACTSIVAAMTDPKYSGMVIVIAGYKAEISSMLDTNPGLKSRFTATLDFPDWDPKDCISLLSKRAIAENFVTDAETLEIFQDGFTTLIRLDGWGNARDVDKIWKASLQHRADRISREGAEIPKKLKACDVQPALDEMLTARRSGANSVPHSFKQALDDGPLQYQSGKPQAPPTFKKETQKIEEVNIDTRNEEDAASPSTPRDEGVSDEVWQALQESKADQEAKETLVRESEKLRLAEEARINEIHREWKMEVERIKKEIADEQERKEAEKHAWEAYQRELETERLENERRRREEDRQREELRKAHAIQERLRQLSPCPMGYMWYQCGGGWRCAGGSHFVSHAQLEKQFTF